GLIDEVDDPVIRNLGPCVDARLVALVPEQGRVRHLDQLADVRGAWVASQETARVASDEREVGFRLAIRKHDGLLHTEQPAGRHLAAHRSLHAVNRAVMDGIPWHLEHHVVVQEFDLILGREDAGFDHPLVARDGELGHRSVQAVGNRFDRGGSHPRSPPNSCGGDYTATPRCDAIRARPLAKGTLTAHNSRAGEKGRPRPPPPHPPPLVSATPFFVDRVAQKPLTRLDNSQASREGFRSWPPALASSSCRVRRPGSPSAAAVVSSPDILPLPGRWHYAPLQRVP